MSRTWTFSMEMWDRTKSSLARVSQLADIQDKPENEDIEFEIFYCAYFQNIKHWFRGGKNRQKNL